jgi:hypothetical protein
MNAHLCAGGAKVASANPPSNVPPTLTCTALASHIAPILKTAGMYADVADIPKQLEAACDTGGWSLELRQCLAAADSVPAMQECIMPAAK